jgi:hypothetical protein
LRLSKRQSLRDPHGLLSQRAGKIVPKSSQRSEELSHICLFGGRGDIPPAFEATNAIIAIAKEEILIPIASGSEISRKPTKCNGNRSEKLRYYITIG